VSPIGPQDSNTLGVLRLAPIIVGEKSPLHAQPGSERKPLITSTIQEHPTVHDWPWYRSPYRVSRQRPVTERPKDAKLTTRARLGTGKTPMLFTKKIGRIRDVLVARGVKAGTIEQDRQGIHYFQIRDPEGNLIEVIEEP